MLPTFVTIAALERPICEPSQLKHNERRQTIDRIDAFEPITKLHHWIWRLDRALDHLGHSKGDCFSNG